MIIEKQDTIVNLPDLLFAKYCIETFGVNRGVFNTIDQWFYTNDLGDIKARRKNIIGFLRYRSGLLNDSERYNLKFGKGNLTNLLFDYTKQKVY